MRLTDNVEHIMSLAQEKARELNQEYVGSEHVLLAILSDDRGAQLFAKIGINFKSVFQAILRDFVARRYTIPEGLLPYTFSTKYGLILAEEVANYLDLDYIDVEQLILGFLRDDVSRFNSVLSSLNKDHDFMIYMLNLLKMPGVDEGVFAEKKINLILKACVIHKNPVKVLEEIEKIMDQ